MTASKIMYGCAHDVDHKMMVFMVLGWIVGIAYAGTPAYLMPQGEDCTQTYTWFPDMVCNDDHALFRYTQLNNDLNDMSSCATCTCKGYKGTDPTASPENEYLNLGPECCDGWAGTLCDLCQADSACPPLNVSGVLHEATECTNTQMAPATSEEAILGKKFSCMCGGGEDAQSKYVCPLQGTYKNVDGSDGATTTRFDWTFTGYGTSSSPGSISLEMNAGIHGNSWTENEPGRFDYFYPIVWSGNLDQCLITEGPCMYVKGTDVSSKTCYNYDCGTTDISCPPEGLPVCPGGVNDCDSVSGYPDKTYYMHKCNVYPASGYDFSISCLKDPNPDGSFVCYYSQSGGAGSNPMSMTCSVGTCLYNITNTTSEGKISFGDTHRYVPRGLAWQEATLLAATCSVLGLAILLEMLRRRSEHAKRAGCKLREGLAARADAATGSSTAHTDDADVSQSQRNPLVQPLGSSRNAQVSSFGDLSSSSGSSIDSSIASSLEDLAYTRPASPTGSAALRQLEAQQRSRNGHQGGNDDADEDEVMKDVMDQMMGVSTRGASAVVASVPTGERARVGSCESSDSGYDPSGQSSSRFGAGASLSWHGVHLWVPARSSDQLSALHAAGAAQYAAFQEPRSPLSGSSKSSTGGDNGLPGSDEEQGTGREAVFPDNSVNALDTSGVGLGGDLEPTASDTAGVFEKQILTDVSATARRGGLTALMGPSGAGKTSLLDCLAGRKPLHRMSGTIKVNGRALSSQRMLDVSGYVPQHDVLPGTLTVKEHLLFHAKLRCPPGTGPGASAGADDAARRRRVADVIEALGLSKCADTRIGGEFTRGLSGGEKRRVSVAEELVVEPGILFLDEPTTGLDSSTALSLVRTLGGIARRGTTVLLSIHQPREDIFRIFDRVVVLCEGGRVVFEGRPDFVPAYLQRAVKLGFCELPRVHAYLDALAAPSHLQRQEEEHEAPAAKLCPPPDDEGVEHDSRSAADASSAAAVDVIAATEAAATAARAAAAAAAASDLKTARARRANPADLLLDVASGRLCLMLADAYARGAFKNATHLTASPLGKKPGEDGSGSGGNHDVDPEDKIELDIVPEEGVDDEEDDDDDEEQEVDAAPSWWWCSNSNNSSRHSLNEKKFAAFPKRYYASFLTQTLVLSERLVLTATRHPMLLALQYTGCLFLAICLGLIFYSLDDTLYGIQDRFGVLFFTPFCLVLLGMSSLPVWRDEHILFTHEQGNKRIYGFPAYFASVLLFDLVLVRTIPPTFFAVVSYQMIGLNKGCDYCLLIFALVLVLTNVISSLIAMTVGAFRFSTSFSNLIGSLLALLFALFAGFLVNKKSMKNSRFPAYLLDPMAYSYEALMINQFGGEMHANGDTVYYTVNGSLCAPGLATTYPTGDLLLATFGFENSQEALHDDVKALWVGALSCCVAAFGVLVASAQAPFYAAAWRRVCAVNPFSLLLACVAAAWGALTGGGGGSGNSSGCSRRSSRGLAQEDALSLSSSFTTGARRGSGGASSTSASVAVAGRSTNGSGSRRSRNGSSRRRAGFKQLPLEGGPDGRKDSMDVSSEDDEEDGDAGEGETSHSHNGSNTNVVTRGSMLAPEGVVEPFGWEHDENAAALVKLLAYQLAHPHGTAASTAAAPVSAGANTGNSTAARPPPMVLSFHDVCLSVPQDATPMAKLLDLRGSIGNNPSGSPDSAPVVLVPLSCVLEGREALGLNLEASPDSGLPVVRAVLPKSWAHAHGVKPGDTLVGVGGRKFAAYHQVTAALAEAPRPVKLDFLRRRRRRLNSNNTAGGGGRSEASAYKEHQRMSEARNSHTTVSDRASLQVPSVHELLARGEAAVPSVHHGAKLVLRNVSGATLASVNAGARAARQAQGPRPSASRNSSGHGDRTALVSSARLPPMVCGIMGPSGAGKTSLLDCLAGRKTVGTVTGQVRLNGKAMTPAQLRLLSGYVVQEDILPGLLSVRECIAFQAQLRVPGNAAQRSNRVDAVLQRLKLVRQQDTPIGSPLVRGISGGEKRRVSVAIELLSEPAVLFLDEPTTGQDSTTAVTLCRALKRIAKDGTTVVMSIHQPRIDIFEMMTQVVFLTREGRVAYCGPTSGLAAYTKNALGGGRHKRSSSITRGLGQLGIGSSTSGHGRLRSSSYGQGGKGGTVASNPADELLDVMAVVEPGALAHEWEKSEANVAVQQCVQWALAYGGADAQAAALAAAGGGGAASRNSVTPTATAAPANSKAARLGERRLMRRLIAERGKHRAQWPAQFLHLSARAMRNTLRNPFPFFLHGVTAVVAASALGMVFQDIHHLDQETAGTQDRFGIMFFLVLYLSLLSLTSLPIWREDQQLFVAERGSGIYSTGPYVVATILFDVLPYRLLPPLAFTWIAYPLIGLNDHEGHKWTFFLILVAANLALSGVCMLVGVLTKTNASANAAGSLAMLTSLLFCGFLLSKSATPKSFKWLQYWSPGSYAYEALVFNEMHNLTGLYITSTISEETIRAGPFTGDELAHCFGFLDEVDFDTLVLLAMAGLYFAAVLVVMQVFVKEKR